jgi:hypothetical protein
MLTIDLGSDGQNRVPIQINVDLISTVEDRASQLASYPFGLPSLQKSPLDDLKINSPSYMTVL